MGTIQAQVPSPPQQAHARPGIFLTLQDRNGKYDMENTVPFSRLRDSSILNFFGIVSQHSNVPLRDINSLTFSFIFAEEFIPLAQTKAVVHKNSKAEEWETLQERLKRSARICISRRTKQKIFEVLVDIGDPREVPSQESWYGA